MRVSIRDIPFFSDEAVFYLEQWTALVVGGGCLATAIWVGFSDLAVSAQRATTGGHAFFLLVWSLTIASSLIGVALLRFAFRGRSPRKKLASRDDARAEHRDASEVANAAHLAENCGGA